MGKIFDEALGIFGDVQSNPEVKVELPSIDELEKKLDEIYPKRSQTNSPSSLSSTTPASPPAQEVATSIKRGCIPCTLGHVSTCTGLLNEAMRFARKDGLGSDQVIEDIHGCISELNALERIDLRPERINALPPWEKELALQALDLSKETRLTLEAVKTPDDLEKIAANLQPRLLAIAKKWVRHNLSMVTSEQAQEIANADSKGV